MLSNSVTNLTLRLSFFQSNCGVQKDLCRLTASATGTLHEFYKTFLFFPLTDRLRNPERSAIGHFHAAAEIGIFHQLDFCLCALVKLQDFPSSRRMGCILQLPASRVSSKYPRPSKVFPVCWSRTFNVPSSLIATFEGIHFPMTVIACRWLLAITAVPTASAGTSAWVRFSSASSFFCKKGNPSPVLPCKG